MSRTMGQLRRVGMPTARGFVGRRRSRPPYGATARSEPWPLAHSTPIRFPSRAMRSTKRPSLRHVVAVLDGDRHDRVGPGALDGQLGGAGGGDGAVVPAAAHLHHTAPVVQDLELGAGLHLPLADHLRVLGEAQHRVGVVAQQPRVDHVAGDQLGFGRGDADGGEQVPAESLQVLGAESRQAPLPWVASVEPRGAIRLRRGAVSRRPTAPRPPARWPPAVRRSGRTGGSRPARARPWS